MLLQAAWYERVRLRWQVSVGVGSIMTSVAGFLRWSTSA